MTEGTAFFAQGIIFWEVENVQLFEQIPPRTYGNKKRKNNMDNAVNTFGHVATLERLGP